MSDHAISLLLNYCIQLLFQALKSALRLFVQLIISIIQDHTNDDNQLLNRVTQLTYYSFDTSSSGGDKLAS